MPLAAAALDARAAGRVTAAAIAAALQGVFYWVILHEAVAPAALRVSTPLEVTIVQTVRRFEPPTLPPKGRQSRWRVVRMKAVPLPAPLMQPTTLKSAVVAARSSPFDWARAMQRELRTQESRQPAKQLRFSFPRQPAPAAAVPKFGWDHASTHRLEALPQGGMLINLNDHCALVVYGFLFPFCRIGRIPVNGHLFDHMRDARLGEPER